MNDWNRRIAGAAAVAQAERIKQLEQINTNLLAAANAVLNAAAADDDDETAMTMLREAALEAMTGKKPEGGESDE